MLQMKYDVPAKSHAHNTCRDNLIPLEGTMVFIYKRTTHMHKRDDILVIQTSIAGITAFRTVTHLDRDTDFHGVNTPHNISDLVYNHQPQLLITGTISGNTEEVAKLVDELRKKNRHLVVVTFSSIPLTGDCFDRQIQSLKPDAGQKVLQAVADFRSGALRR